MFPTKVLPVVYREELGEAPDVLQPYTCSQLPQGNIEALWPAVIIRQLSEARSESHQGVAVDQQTQEPEKVILKCEIPDLCHERVLCQTLPARPL